MIQDLLNSLADNADRQAFCINDQYYTYRDLQCHVVAIQRQIESLEVGERKNIAVVCSNDIRTYGALLAIWFSGCAYVPLGLHNPVDRNLTILDGADTDIVIAAGVEFDSPQYRSLRIIRPVESPDPDGGAIRHSITEGTDLAYILFTSGSTGAPKGVPISHSNLAAFIKAFRASPFTVGKEDRCLQMFELTFDVSVSSYLPALLAGACVYTVPNDGIKYMHVLRVLTRYKLTCIQIVPSIVKLAKPLLKRISVPETRACILTGEATMADLLPIWRPCIPEARIFNYYGPTEATIYCSYLEYSEARPKTYNGMLAIGKAFEGMELLVVNEKGEETAMGEKGELLIGGPQVTEGYIKNESKNREAFIQRSAGSGTKRFYRSGDMCYRDEDGDIFYCGRFDNQVKIQGFRIELSEIEFLVRTQLGYNNVVIVTEDEQGAARLVLVVENRPDADMRPIITHLKGKLPEYMVPAAGHFIEEFPLNTSGKTDRKRIKEILNGSIGS